MHPTIRPLAHCLAGAMLMLACACSSNSTPDSSSSSSGGQRNSASSSLAGQSGGASGGTQSSSSSQAGHSSAPTAGSSASSGGQSTASGGTTASNKGGTSSTLQTGATGGGGQGGTTSRSSTSTSSGGAGGSSSTATGGSPANDAGVADAGEPASRRVLLSDEGNRRVLLVDLQNPSAAVWTWQLDASKYGDGMRDLQLVGGDRVAVSVLKGYVELDLKTGEIKKEVTGFTGVESLRRLPNGDTILGGNSEGGVTLQELDSKDQPVSGHKVTFTSFGQNLRLFRRTPQGTFLLAVGAKLAEVNWDKKTVWEMSIPDGDWVFQGLRVDKNIAVTSGYGASILVIDPTSKTVLTKIGGKSQPDAASIVPNFYAGFQVLANGHYVVTNWEGHGGGNGSKGIQLLEYDASGALVWKWKQDAKLVSSLHGAIVLDGLDTSKLHDDVNGVLAPVTE